MKFLRLIGLLCPLVTSGCGQAPTPVVIEAGRMDAKTKSDTSPAPAFAIYMLSEALGKNPKTTHFTVNFQSGYPSGKVFSKHLIYDRSARTLSEKSDTGIGLNYSEVTDEMIIALSSKKQSIDFIEEYGAKRVPHPMENNN